jgi:hypothetical protein
LRPSGQNLSRPSPSHGFAPPSESLTTFRRRPLAGRPPLLGFLPLWRLGIREIHSPRVCLARFVPPSGFLNLLTAFPSPYLADLFHSADTWGFSLQSFPLSRSRDVSQRLFALLSFSFRDLPSEEGRPSDAAAFRALLPSRIRCFRFAVTLSGCPLLSWDSFPLGFSLSPPWTVLPPSSPPDLGSRFAEA